MQVCWIPSCASTFAATLQNDLVFVIIEGDRSQRIPPTEAPFAAAVSPHLPRKQPGSRRLHASVGRVAGICFLFSTHRCHLGRGSPTKRAQPDGDGSISRFTGRAFGKAVIYQQMSTGLCSSALVSKNKRVFNKHERKHTTTRKEGRKEGPS